MFFLFLAVRAVLLTGLFRPAPRPACCCQPLPPAACRLPTLYLMEPTTYLLCYLIRLFYSANSALPEGAVHDRPARRVRDAGGPSSSCCSLGACSLLCHLTGEVASCTVSYYRRRPSCGRHKRAHCHCSQTIGALQCHPLPRPPQNVHEFEDREFANVSKEDLKLDEDKGSKKREKALKVGCGAVCCLQRGACCSHSGTA